MRGTAACQAVALGIGDGLPLSEEELMVDIGLPVSVSPGVA